MVKQADSLQLNKMYKLGKLVKKRAVSLLGMCMKTHQFQELFQSSAILDFKHHANIRLENLQN